MKKKEIKKEEFKADYICSTFIDFRGVQRHFVIAAVSMPAFLSYGKNLYLGVSVQREGDDYDEELGKRIAYGKAVHVGSHGSKNRFHYMYASCAGMINNTVVKALLEQEAAYFKTNPAEYITGYNKDSEKYWEKSKKSMERTKAAIENTSNCKQTSADHIKEPYKNYNKLKKLIENELDKADIALDKKSVKQEKEHNKQDK